MGQHFTNNLDSAVANGLVLGYESLEEMAEHPRHEAVCNGVFIVVPACSLALLFGCRSARLVNAGA